MVGIPKATLIMVGYKGTWYRRKFGAGYNPRSRKWPQENGYGKRYGIKEKKGADRSYRQNGTQSQIYYITQGLKRNGQYLPTKGTGNGQGGDGGDGDKDDKRKFKSSKYDFEDKKDEESDTEDFCELEITPEQLSQVVPGGGVLNIKLSKRKPIKITTRAPDGEPDPAQTKVKAIHDSINRRDEQPILSPESGMMVGVGQSVERKVSLGGIKQSMLRMSREERFNIQPQRMGRPNSNDSGASDKMGTPMTMVMAQTKMEELEGIEILQIGEEEDLLEEMGIQVEEMEVLILMIVGMEMTLHP